MNEILCAVLFSGVVLAVIFGVKYALKKYIHRFGSKKI